MPPEQFWLMLAHRSYRTDEIRAARPTARTFSPRYAIELTPSGMQAIPPTTTRAPSSDGMFGATRRTPSSSRATRGPVGAFGRTSRTVRSGRTYVYQCGVCLKRFPRTTQDSALRPHKTPNGFDCPGRTGYLVEMR